MTARRKRRSRKGGRKRLQRRFAAYDARDVLLMLGLIFGGFAIATIVAAPVESISGSNDLAWKVMFVGLFFYCVAAVVLQRKLRRKWVAQYDLVCQGCGKSLAKRILSRRHPDRRNDGELPRRCPHCHLPIEEVALRRKITSN